MKAVNRLMTPTLYNIVYSELMKNGYDEIVDEDGNLVFFDDEYQMMSKIMNYDEDVQHIMDYMFNELSLTKREHDLHFKKVFFYRFINRKINRQTIESFKFELMSTFLSNQDFINRIYTDVELYLTQTQLNEQTNEQNNQEDSEQNNEETDESRNKENTQQSNKQNTEGNTTSDNRQAYADLPQNNVQIDVNDTVMDSATNNEISRNKQSNQQDVTDETLGETTGETTGERFGKTTGKTTGESYGETVSENKSYHFDELFKTNGLMEQVLNQFDVKCFLQVW